MDTTLYWSRFPGKFVSKTDGKSWQEIFAEKGLDPADGPKFTGNVSEWYETLVETITDCIQQLQDATFAKYGRAKRAQVNVYVHADVGCMLQTSVRFKPPPEGTEPTDRASRPLGHFTYPSETGGFTVHEDAILGNDAVRIVATFDTDDGVDKTMYGTVKILDMPENGRRA